MVTVEQFSRIVTAVHAAAVAPQAWTDAMALVRTTLGATGCGLITGGLCDRDVECCSVPDVEAMAAYRDYYGRFDYVLDAVDASPVGLVHSGRPLVALNPRSEFNVDWMRRHAMDDGIFVKVTDEPHPCCFIVAAPDRDEPFATTDRLRAVNALVPHVQQAMRTQAELAELHERRHTGHPVDSLSGPAAVVRSDATVVYANDAAEALFGAGVGIAVRGGRVHLTLPAADTEFRRALSNTTHGGAHGARTGDSVPAPRPGNRRPLVVHLSPIDDVTHRNALVLVTDPENRREPSKDVVKRVFSLTNAEADVALRVVRGDDLATIADDMSLSLATIKTHVQHVYDKTDTHRQAGLVRLMLAIMP